MDSSSGPPPPAADGRLIAGRFRLLEPLGRGGMGRVYRAQDDLLGRLVAVKLIYDDAIVDSDVRHACALEARAAARLNHPGIVRILDSGFDDGHLYVVMSLADGRTLSEVIRTDGPLPIARALEIAAQVADALEAAHQEGIIHCDVKPGNLIVRADGTVQLVDFGIAKIAASTTSLDSSTLQGSAEYVAPEQVEGTDVDGRTDLYALGVVLFESLAGRTPFGGGTIASVLARRLVNDAPSVREYRPDATPAVERLMRRMLAREPSDRFQTAAELRDALLTTRASVLAAALPSPPVRPLTATMPIPQARAAALRARAARTRAAAARQRERATAATRQAGVTMAAGLLAALRHARAFVAWAGAWAGPFMGAQLARLAVLEKVVRERRPAWLGKARGRGTRALRRPSLASSFGIAIVVGLLLGTAAARCNVAGAATSTALGPDTASAATAEAADPPPTAAAPALSVAPPSQTSAPATLSAPPPPTSTPLPPPTSEPAAAQAPAPPATEPAPANESAPAPPAAPAAAESLPPAGPPPVQLLVTAPANKPEGRPADPKPDDEKKPEEKRLEEKRPEEKRDDGPKTPENKPDARKPENNGPPARGNGNGRGGDDEKPKQQQRGNGNGSQKKR